MESLGSLPKARGFYVAAGIAAAVFVGLIILDIAASLIAGEAPASGSLSAVDVFAMFRSRPLGALQYLGILNVIEQMLLLVVVYAFSLAHRETCRNSAGMTLAVFVLGLAIYIANNVSLPLYSLSTKYALAGASERQLLAAAGESLLARGEDFTPGSLPGFVVIELAVFMMLFVMLKARVFSRISSILGLLGAFLLTVFTFGATFSPTLFNPLMPVSMAGGVLMLAWYVLIALRFFRLARCQPLQA